jgi:hypothetical protein
MSFISGTSVKRIYTHIFAGKAFIYGELDDGTKIRIPEETIFDMLKYFDFVGDKKSTYAYLINPMEI